MNPDGVEIFRAVQNGPKTHRALCATGTEVFPELIDRSVVLTGHFLLVLGCE